ETAMLGRIVASQARPVIGCAPSRARPAMNAKSRMDVPMNSSTRNSTKNQYSDRGARPRNVTYFLKQLEIAWPKSILNPPERRDSYNALSAAPQKCYAKHFKGYRL